MNPIVRLARYIAAKLGGFPEAHTSAVDPRIYSRGAQPDWSLEQGWDRRYCVDRAQQMHRANVLAGTLLERSTEHVIGPGYRLQVLTKDPGFNRDSRLMWEEWANSPFQCDVRARATFTGMLGEAYLGKMRDGDSLMYMRDDGRLRVVNSIEIASPTGGYWRTTDADGVERDLDGKHTAYWIHEPQEVAYSNIRAAINTLMKVPAKDCVFLARTPLGAQQTRGITAFLGAFQLLERADGTLTSIATKAQLASKFAMVILKKSPLPSVSLGNSLSQTMPLTKIEDGTLTRLETDEDIKPIQSMDPSANLLDLVEFFIRIVGARFGLSLATIVLDHSDHNFSNARASAIETNAGNLLRQLVMCQAASEVRTMKTLEWIRKGELTSRRRSTMEAALKHRWRLPARPLVEPLTERQADLLGLDIGALTWEDIAAREGKTANELFKKQAHERKVRAKLGLPDVRSNMTREEVEKGIGLEGGRPEGKGPKKDKQRASGSGLVMAPPDDGGSFNGAAIEYVNGNGATVATLG